MSYEDSVLDSLIAYSIKEQSDVDTWADSYINNNGF
jgi:hypothetical protein